MTLSRSNRLSSWIDIQTFWKMQEKTSLHHCVMKKILKLQDLFFGFTISSCFLCRHIFSWNNSCWFQWLLQLDRFCIKANSTPSLYRLCERRISTKTNLFKNFKLWYCIEILKTLRFGVRMWHHVINNPFTMTIWRSGRWGWRRSGDSYISMPCLTGNSSLETSSSINRRFLYTNCAWN